MTISTINHTSANITNQTERSKTMFTFTPITKNDVDWGRPLLFVEGELRMVVRRVFGKRSFEVAEVQLPDEAHTLPDGWYRYPDNLVAGATWRRSRKAAAALLYKVVIVVERGNVRISRMERVEEGIAWNVEVDWWLTNLARDVVPVGVQDGIFPCPPNLADMAVWPTRALYNVSPAYGDRERAGVRDIQEIARLMGERAPKLVRRLTVDDDGRDIRVYINVRTREIILSDIWLQPE